VTKNENENISKQLEKVKGETYSIQMIAIKEDFNMIRVYSAICKSDFLNPGNNKNEQS
jgi:hypothetical protein